MQDEATNAGPSLAIADVAPVAARGTEHQPGGHHQVRVSWLLLPERHVQISNEKRLIPVPRLEQPLAPAQEPGAPTAPAARAASGSASESIESLQRPQGMPSAHQGTTGSRKPRLCAICRQPGHRSDSLKCPQVRKRRPEANMPRMYSFIRWTPVPFPMSAGPRDAMLPVQRVRASQE